MSHKGFRGSSAGKESTCHAGDLGAIPGLGRSPGEGKGYPLQYSGLENFMDCTVHGVTKSRTRLNDFHFTSFKNQISRRALPQVQAGNFISCVCRKLDSHSCPGGSGAGVRVGGGVRGKPYQSANRGIR